MPMILAMNGAFDLANLGAASTAIADLQEALVSLGKGIGDNTLSKIVVDGVMGPKTAAAVNRALTVHLGSGQAPANLRTGSLPQATIKSQAATITQLIQAEVHRRGFSLIATKVAKPKTVVKKTTAVTSTASMIPASAVPAAAPGASAYTPPAAAAAVSPVYRVPPSSGMDMDAIIKWSAVGVGVVVLAGVAYYLATRKRAPAMAGFSAVLPQPQMDSLEALMDRSGGVSDIFETMSEIAVGKAQHVRSDWQDERLAKRWEGFARKMDRLAASTRKFEVG